MTLPAAPTSSRAERPLGPVLLRRSVVLVGLMGAGKTSVGRRLARSLATPFKDADEEIVAAAGMSVADIFALYGEPRFREVERRVVARLLDEPPQVLALGGGAFIDPETRARVKSLALSVWLRADLATLLARTLRKKGTRPLLAGSDPHETLARLMEQRYPIYAEADHAIDTAAEPHEVVVQRITALLPPAEAS